MKLLLLLAVFFHHTNGQSDIIRNCMRGEKETDISCRLPKEIACKTPESRANCPFTCDECNTAKLCDDAKLVLLKKCPDKGSDDGQNPICWEIQPNNGESDVLRLYPTQKEINGDADEYFGEFARTGDKVLATGDVKKGIKETLFQFQGKSTLTECRTIEVNPRTMYPIQPGFFKVVLPSDKKSSRSVDRDLDETRDNEWIGSRTLDKSEGRYWTLIPVVDKKGQEYMKTEGKDPKMYAQQIADLAVSAFDDRTSEVKFHITVAETYLWAQSAAPTAEGYSFIQQNFPFGEVAKGIKGAVAFLFMTKVGPLGINKDYNAVYAKLGTVCDSDDDENFAVIDLPLLNMENDVTHSTIGLGYLLGVQDDFHKNGILQAKPRFIYGKSCTSKGGFMDFPTGAATHWSECSHKDMRDALKKGWYGCMRRECTDRGTGCKEFTDLQCVTDLGRKRCRKTCEHCGEDDHLDCKDTDVACSMPDAYKKRKVCPKTPGTCPKFCGICWDATTTTTKKPEP